MQDLNITKKFFVVEGATVGQITCLLPVQDTYHHPLIHDTPRSYIRQGHLWECECKCGVRFLISEFALSKGECKSCGCLRRAKKGINSEKRQTNLRLKIRRRELNNSIKILRYELEELKLLPTNKENHDRIEIVAAELRSAHAEKASLASKYHNNGEMKKRPRKFTNQERIEHLKKFGVEINAPELAGDWADEWAKKEQDRLNKVGRKGLELT